jgi:hypothetical protein
VRHDHRVESAIVLAVPEAEPLVGALRQEGDASAARGVPAHVTLLYPFVDDPDEGVLEELRFFFSHIDALDLDLTSVQQWPEVVYLAMDQAPEVNDLIAALCRRWPSCPPYGGLFAVEEVIPHLTVIDSPDPALRERAVKELEAGLPLRAQVTEASLWVHGGYDGTDRWTLRAVFPLAVREAD